MIINMHVLNNQAGAYPSGSPCVVVDVVEFSIGTSCFPTWRKAVILHTSSK